VIALAQFGFGGNEKMADLKDLKVGDFLFNVNNSARIYIIQEISDMIYIRDILPNPKHLFDTYPLGVACVFNYVQTLGIEKNTIWFVGMRYA